MTFDITFWLILTLSVSIIINMFFVWYIRRLLITYLFIAENIDDLVLMVSGYGQHLKKIHGLEMYYGDETIQHLMSHTNSLIEILKEYQDPESILVPLEEVENIEEELENNEDYEQKTKINKENVFYAGSRRRDS